jgi:hypothetical protein
MKKNIILLSVLSLVFAMTACNVIEVERDEPVDNTPAKEVVLVPMTFSASCSYDGVDEDDPTRTVLDGFDIKWKAGDKIAVFDNIDPSSPHEFEADSDGASTTFTGMAAAGATKFFAVYPYSAADNCSADDSGDYVGYMNVNIPDVQRPVAGSFDPAAAVVVAYSGSVDNTFNFKVPFALVKFKVDYDDVFSVSFSSGKRMTGSLKTNLKANGSIGTGDGDGTKYTTLTIKNDDNSPLVKGETYYAVMRYRTDANSYTSFTATLGNTACGYATKVASSDVGLARKTINNLGTFTGLAFTTDRYRGYQDGLDVVIAGNTYNVSTDGDATLLADAGVFNSSTSGVVFVAADASITNTSEATITGNVILASNDLAHPATYTGTSGKSIILKSGSLVMDNMIVDLNAMESGQFMTKKDNEGNFSSLTLYQCDFKNIKRYIYSPNSSYLNNGIETITVNGCRFATPVAVQLFAVNSAATTLAGYGLFTFTNNVVYSTTGEPLQTYIFSTSATGVSEVTAKQDLVMDNNLFYNVAASSGIFRTYYVNSAYIRNNVLWAKDGSYGSNIKLFGLNLETAKASSVFTGASSNNYCFGDLGTKSWTISDSKYRGPLTNVTTLDETPIESFNASTGVFELKAAYTTYGPQIQPL